MSLFIKLVAASLSLLLTSTVACKKHEGNYMSSGTLKGYDMAACACCGGLLMEIDGDTASQAERIIRFANATDWGFTEAETYPVRVRFDYVLLQNFCGRRVINVTRLRRE